MSTRIASGRPSDGIRAKPESDEESEGALATRAWLLVRDRELANPYLAVRVGVVALVFV